MILVIAVNLSYLENGKILLQFERQANGGSGFFQSASWQS